jgi:hypothetical protein
MHRFIAMRTEGNSIDTSIGASACNSNIFVACNFGGTVAKVIDDSPRWSRARFFACTGYITDNWGTTTISAGQTGIVVSHGLTTTPSFVTATGTSTDTTELYVTSITATTFKVTSAIDVESNRVVYWKAEV